MVLLVADAKIAIAIQLETTKRGKSRRKGRTTTNSKDSRVFFREWIPSARAIGKTKGRDRDGKIKEEESEDPKSGLEEEGRKSEGRRARRVYRLPSPLPKVPTESHSPLGLQANPSRASSSELSWRRGIPDFPPVSEKGDDVSRLRLGDLPEVEFARSSRRMDATELSKRRRIPSRDDRIYSRISMKFNENQSHTLFEQMRCSILLR